MGAPDGPTITLSGTNLTLANIDQVGFFSTDQTAPKTAVPVTFAGDDADGEDPQRRGQLPGRLVDPRPHQGHGHSRRIANKWSARSEARPLQVGDAVLSCDATSTSGNFGSIDFPWGGNDLDDLEMAIRKGPQPPETLKAWSGALPGDNACHGMAASGAVYSEDSSVKENTNCVNTVTGLKAKPAYDGYLKAGSGKLLVDTLPACTAVGRPIRGSLGENSDVLSCFLNKDTLKLSDAVGYTGSVPLFTQDIYNSPRFAIVPILEHDPSGNKWMPIKAFVPAFITDQPTGASRTAPLVTGATDNGLVVQNPEKLRAIRMFFFSLAALPPPPDGTDLQDYFGTGPKTITLLN